MEEPVSGLGLRSGKEGGSLMAAASLSRSPASFVEKGSVTGTMVDRSGGGEGAVIGRERELRSLRMELQCGRSVLVVGEAGVGKRTVVEAMNRVWEVEWKLLAAQSEHFRDFALGFQRKANGGNGIIFVDELDLLKNLCEKPEILWQSSKPMDRVPTPWEFLKDGVETGDFQIVGTASERQSRKVTESMPKLSVLRISAMTADQTKQILRAKRKSLEKKYSIRLAESAIAATIHLTEEYIPMGNFPKQAIEVLEKACEGASGAPHVLLTENDVLRLLSSWTRISVERLRSNKHHREEKKITRVVSVQNVKRFQRVMSEHNLTELRNSSTSPASSGLAICRARSTFNEEVSFSPESPTIYI